jgi:hypothetical protein
MKWGVDEMSVDEMDYFQGVGRRDVGRRGVGRRGEVVPLFSSFGTFPSNRKLKHKTTNM